MAEPRLGPDELDRLEDALEGLESMSEFADPSPAVSERLADFQLILQASRDALPLQDVRPGLLDGVLSEARMSTQDIEATVTPSQPKGEGFWSRLRKAWLLPGLAVAGSAALVLVLVQPTMSDEAPATEVAAKADAKPSADAPAPGEFDKEEAARPEEPAAPPPPPAAAAPMEQTKSAAEPEPQPVAPAKAEAKADVSKGQGWDAVEDGDRARAGGDCFTARNHYARALDDGNDSVRARAYVGMGLCKQEEGNQAAAADYFEQARALDEDAVEFAGMQRQERAPSKPKARRPSRKRSAGKTRKKKLDTFGDPLQGL